MTTLIPVILSGGAGTRLWPLSREMYPKQLLALTGKQTMLQDTVLRLAGILNDAPPEVPDMTIGQRREVLGHPERVHASEERRRA